MTKVIVKKNAGCFELPRAIVNELWERIPRLFGEPLDDYSDMASGKEALEDEYSWAVERNGLAYFLELHNPILRTLPWLVSKVESGDFDDEIERELARDLAVIELPSDVSGWYIEVRDDGSEVIHEEHRIFRPSVVRRV